MDEIKWVISNYGVISLLAIAIFGLIIRLRKFISDANFSIQLSNSLRSVFTDDPAKEIDRIFRSIRNAHDTLEIRSELAEERIKLGIFICGRDGACSWTNDYLNSIFGLDSQDMLGFEWLGAIHPDDRKRVNDEWLYAVHNRIRYNCVYTICNERDRTSLTVTAYAVAIVNEKDEVQCYVGYIIPNDEVAKECHFNRVKPKRGAKP